MKTINARVCVMRGTLEQFQTSNIVLLDGEVAYIADKGKLKIGNNNTPFNDLPYIADNGFKGTIDSIDQLPTSGNNDGDQYFLLTSGQLYIYANNQWLTVTAAIPAATGDTLGGIYSSNEDNTISVAENGIATINNITTDKLINGTNTLILDGGQITDG